MTGLAIIGASGNILKGVTWTPTLENIEIGINTRHRTYLDHINDEATYLIANGAPEDFHSLGQDHGFQVAPHTQLWFRSRIWHSSNANTRIIVIEYDKHRQRLGESLIVANNDALVQFNDETRYALLALRIRGKGRIAFTELQAHLDEIKEGTTGSGVQHYKLNTLTRQNDLEVDDLRAQVRGIEDAVQRLSHQLNQANENPVFQSPPTQSEARNARDDGSISGTREYFIRDLLLTMADALPDSNGSHHFMRLNLNIGIIADESMYNFYKDSCREVHYLSPTNYEEILNTQRLDAIIYVTCWKGRNGDEWRGIKFREEPLRALGSILAHARLNAIPTVFQSIEDPSNFDYFLPVAMRFDHVFTSDTECIEKYRFELGHNRVYYGEYGANPSVNNPIGSYRHDIPRALFSGSYPERYPKRTEDMKTIFGSIPDQQNHLTIIDRNFDATDFHFPEEFQQSIIGALPHDKLQKVHKLFRYSLNFNSIKESPTMCAMRVYELQAQGKPLISNYARSVFNKFPEIRIVPHDTSLKEIRAHLPNAGNLVSAQNALIRLMCQKTSYHVVSSLFETIGLVDVRQAREETILVVALGCLETVAQMVERQKYVTATIVSENEFASSSPGAIAQYGYVAAVSSDRDYSDHYLASRLAGFVYTDSLFITQKAAYLQDGYSPGPIHEYVEMADDRETTMISTAHKHVREFITGRIIELRGRGYAVDPYQIGYKAHLKAKYSQAEKTNPRLTIVIPVYNNGEYLLNKCLPSVQRNEGWESFKILLVDDGSTNPSTHRICQELASIYDNIQLISYADGGSGSASRPRNRGINETTTEFITFLDPDNEISVDGYTNLLKQYDHLRSSGAEVDFISGYQVKVASTTTVTGLHTDRALRIVNNPVKDFFAQGRFPVISSQAAIMKTRYLHENSIDFVEKAAGQDTLFGWEILATAQSIAFTNDTHIAYYAERDGSVTNDVDARYFQKNLVLEREQVKRLHKLRILDLYKKHHLDQFFRNWYLERLKLVRLTETNASREYLEQIANLYGQTLDHFESKTSTKEYV